MSSSGADGNGFSQKTTRTKLHIPPRRLATHSSQVRGTEPVLSSENDVEKGHFDNYGPFDPRYFLSLFNESNRAAGIQPRHVGVTWEDLQVMVHGDRDCKVKSFSWKFDQPSYSLIRHTSRHLTVGSFVCSWTA